VVLRLRPVTALWHEPSSAAQTPASPETQPPPGPGPLLLLPAAGELAGG